MARAFGSYPKCPRFESRCRYQRARDARASRALYGPLVKWLRHRPFTAVTWVRFPYGSPRRSKVRSAQNPAALLELPDSSSALPCSSFPNRTHFVGLRFGCFFILKISRVFHDVASDTSLATTFYVLHQKSSALPCSPPQLEPAAQSFKLVLLYPQCFSFTMTQKTQAHKCLRFLRLRAIFILFLRPSR